MQLKIFLVMMSCGRDSCRMSAKVVEDCSSQYSTGELWRLSQFYVNPLSSEIIELGTISYPYKSMKAVSSDILNNFSHLNVNITIYLKEYESIYMSDLTGYYLNITSILITSYSTSSNS